MLPLPTRLLLIAAALAMTLGCSRRDTSTGTIYRAKDSGRETVMLNFARSAAETGEHFFYIRIPGNIRPEDRDRMFEEPLAAALKEHKAGRVTGAGSQLGKDRTIAFCGLDVVVQSRAEGLTLIRNTLRSANAPAGTVIEEYLPTRIDHPLVP